MPKVIYSQFDGGLAIKDRNIPTNQFAVGDGVDIYSLPGYIRPGLALTTITKSDDVTQIIDGRIKDICVDNVNSKVYIMGASKLYQLTELTNLVAASFNNNFDGSSHYYYSIANSLGNTGHNNLIIYPIGTDKKLFYTWGKISGGNAGNMGMYPLTGTTFDDDWLSTVPANAAALSYNRHPLLEWNGMLWIGDGNKLAKLDGQTGDNGTFTDATLTLPVGYEILKLFPTQNYIGVIANFKGATNVRADCRVFFYDGTSDTYTYFIPIAERAAYCAINKNGDIQLGGQGGEPNASLYRLTNQGIEKIMPLKHIVNGTEISFTGIYPNSMDVSQNLTLLAGAEERAVIFAYGNKTNEPNAFSIPYRLSTAASDLVETIKQVSNTKILVGWQVASGEVAYLSKINLSGTTYGTADYKAGYTDFGQEVKINYIKFYFKPLVSGDSITCGLDVDYGTAKTLGIGTGNVSYTKDGTVTSKKFSNLGFQCHAFRPTITWAAGGVAISKIVIDYQYISD